MRPRKGEDAITTEIRHRLALLWRRSLLLSKECKGIRTVRNSVEKLIDRAVARAGLPLTTYYRPKRGRPLRSRHPLPRRMADFLDKETCLSPKNHRERHKAHYVPDCASCYMREYVYFRNHPEDRPLLDEQRKRRPWVDENWEKDYQDVKWVPRTDSGAKIPKKRVW